MKDEETNVNTDFLNEKHSIKILVVDDEAIMREILSDILIYEGYKVFTAMDAESALELLKTEPFDIIVTDIKMPGIDGIELMKRIKRISSQIDIIVITAYETTESKEEAAKLGAMDYITKPVNVEYITAVVEKTVKKRLAAQQALEKGSGEYPSQIDGLTGVFAIDCFNELLKKEIARAQRQNKEVSLIILNIDDFKIYNDTNGRLMGDLVLKKLAWVIKNYLRESDFIARCEKDEFAVILPDTSAFGTETIAKRLINLIQLTAFDGEKILPQKKISLSIGGASYPSSAATQEELIAHAKEALKQAKNSGKNCVCMFYL